ncbi:FAD binding domain-containing protein [Xylaria sp. CBS 124048]|nr:FAD binding domain-containing protein [Xylaria sp. CBS 124048]
MQKQLDVLIVGAGPTGMTMALELVAQGISFRIIDKASERSPFSRALVIHSRSFETFKRHKNIGVEELFDLGMTAPKANIFISEKKIGDADINDMRVPGTEFPFPRVVSQNETERWLERALAKHGVQIEKGVEVKHIAQDADGVSVTVATSDGAEEEIRAKYIVGADGAHSAVRHAAKNITFDGDAYPQAFICADAYMETPLPTNEAYMCFGNGVLIVIPLKSGRVRLVVSRPGQDNERELTLDDFEDAVRVFFPGGGSLHDPEWIARFHLHHRCASSYRDGRLFVAGDAAHIHSPAAGQGMNTGIQDAANLGWKLAAVVRGEKPDSFLDSYNNERHPIGQYLLASTDKAFTFVTWTNPIFVYLRSLFLPWIFPLVMRNKSRILNNAWFMSQLRIRYRKSDIVGTSPQFTGTVKGGDRLVDGKIKASEGERWLQDLLTPESYHLLLFSGLGQKEASEGDLDRARTLFLENTTSAAKASVIFSAGQKGQAGYIDLEDEIHKKLGFNDAGYVLVRPDGYIAHVGPLKTVEEAIKWM